MAKTALFLAGQLLLALMATGLYLLFQNSLSNYPDWTVTKRTLSHELIGADGFSHANLIETRNAVDLGGWHGFQEILFNKKVSPDRVSFDFLLGRNSYFCFLFKKTAQGFAGIRISVSNRFQDVFFIADTEGRFIEKKPLSLAHPHPDQWYHVQVLFTKEGPILYLEGHPVGPLPIKLPESYLIGFRGGHGKGAH